MNSVINKTYRKEDHLICKLASNKKETYKKHKLNAAMSKLLKQPGAFSKENTINGILQYHKNICVYSNTDICIIVYILQHYDVMKLYI